MPFAGNKIFVVGRNKTGTTSIGAALRSLGFRVGDQQKAEKFIEDWSRRDFREIISYCETADAFQDSPFSLDYTYQAVDYAYPNSRFILSIRDNPKQWYQSLTRFHSKLIGKNSLPTPDDLKEYFFRKKHKGSMWRSQQLIYGIDENSLYDFDKYTKHYSNHNDRVLDYFRHRPNDLLVLNVADPSSIKKLCSFLGMDHNNLKMPHLQRSKM